MKKIGVYGAPVSPIYFICIVCYSNHGDWYHSPPMLEQIEIYAIHPFYSIISTQQI